RFDVPASLGPFGNERGTGPPIDRFVAGGGAVATTDIWRDFGFVRHIATPSIGYSNVFWVSEDPEALVQLDEVEAVRASEFVPFGLRNRFQLPRGAPGGSVDAVDWNIQARWFPKPSQNEQGGRFG